MSRSFNSILVANRGEIAVRIMRTASALGYRTIAIYSDADSAAPHVRMADEAVRIGPSPAAESYLDIDRAISAARESAADAIHPGYGFLSENADFARACEDAGLIFIGPGAEAIALMGNKAAAKRHMQDAGVPCVPGYEGEDQSNEAFEKAAGEIGLPVMIKAAAGGGGRGMRLVEDATRLGDALDLARSESLNAFGSDELILEKAIVRPRHVEIQVFADSHGNAIHLGERDCSVQRRHQKIIEEAPCPVMTEELRRRMGGAAVTAARSIDYQGAGTMEFLLDGNGEFYFLEMNTRLQVEHPVTEMITGLDLVAMQIDIAAGNSLPLAQEDVELAGHAIEVRLYAEDANNNFMPSSGKVHLWSPPAGPGVRVDSGIDTGLEVTPFYDSMVAKIVAHGASREEARTRLIDALADTALFGPATNRDFLIRALNTEHFAAGEATTAFVEESMRTPGEELDLLPVAAAMFFTGARHNALRAAVRVPPEMMNWNSAGGASSRFTLLSGDRRVTFDVSPTSDGGLQVNDSNITIGGDNGTHIGIVVDGVKTPFLYCRPRRDDLYLASDTTTLQVSDVGGRSQSADAASGGRVTAPMHGLLLDVFVSEGDAVEKGARLAVLEAMKMQHEIRAQVDGTVTAVHAEAGAQIAADTLILEIDGVRPR